MGVPLHGIEPIFSHAKSKKYQSKPTKKPPYGGLFVFWATYTVTTRELLLAGAQGIEPRTKALEALVIPFNYTPLGC
jgi:hypothetical protein